ncbi:MAG: sigma 54-interacting transcriptional regulator [Deltaproteobacteria bacterium]|nr:sigma 54-interacting transcriptional regulator [Deltaproteobacteria bacterium]
MTGRTNPTSNILIVDDDLDAAETVAESLRARGFRATPEVNPAEALNDAMKDQFDVVVTDLQMRSLDGLALCERIVGARPDLPVVVMTGHASVDAAVGALRAGAFDFIVKPVDPEILALTVERAVQHHQLHSEVHRLRSEAAISTGSSKLLGESPAMRRVQEIIRRIAPTQATVLVTGESGTGKELVARAIHESSGRADGPFIAINCAAVPATLLESELFGHAKGAFTDAKVQRRGLFLEAQGGTLFLDEIGEMPLEMQVKLLRALQERTVRPVGGNQEMPFDARVVAATNRDLEKEIAEKRFREDLYYRVNVCSVPVPSLREREGDVPLLARTFVERFAKKHEKAVKGIAAPALAKIVQYDWPGNVRELENGIERAVAMAQHDQLVVEDLPERVRAYRPEGGGSFLPSTVAELVTMEELERRYVDHVLKLVKGNKSRAARVLGFDRRTLYRRLEKTADPTGAVTEGGAEPIEADDEPMEATKVPAVRPEIPKEPASGPISVRPIASDGASTRSGKSILVVDDDRDSLELLQLVLEAKGYAVQTASGVAEAMRTRGVDVVLTDVQLGDGSGSALVGRFGKAPVIAISGATRADDLGFDAWLSKPVSLERLTQTLDRFLPPTSPEPQVAAS